MHSWKLKLHIADWREHRGLTQEQLAKAIGINRVSLARLETGHSEPKTSTLFAIATVLGTTCEDLCEEPPNDSSKLLDRLALAPALGPPPEAK